MMSRAVFSEIMYLLKLALSAGFWLIAKIQQRTEAKQNVV